MKKSGIIVPLRLFYGRKEKMEAITNVITQIDTLVWGWWMILLLHI